MKIKKIKIEDLKLQKRTENWLKKQGILFINDLFVLNDLDLWREKYFGIKMYDDIGLRCKIWVKENIPFMYKIFLY